MAVGDGGDGASEAAKACHPLLMASWLTRDGGFTGARAASALMDVLSLYA